MKKILIGVLILAVVFLLAFMLGGLLGPKDFKMDRSVVINAPRAVVFKNISDYKNWINWSPWAKIDSNCKYEYSGTQGQTGAGFKWKGNEKAGEGEMRTVSMTENDSLTSQLTFLKPWHSEAVVDFILTEDSIGYTKVTWSFSQTYSFTQRPLMLFFNMEKMLGGDYEHGLANLKAVSEKQAAENPPVEVKEVAWEAHTYLADRAVVAMKDLGNVFQEKMPKTFTYAKKNKLQIEEPAATGLYYTWDTVAGTTDAAIAVRLKKAAKVSGRYSIIKVGASKALMVDYYGPYNKMKPTHDAIHQYAKDKGLKLKSPAIEEYVGDPGTEKDPNKVLTKVYYLIAE